MWPADLKRHLKTKHGLKRRDAVPQIEGYTPPPPLQCIMNTLEIDTLLKKHPHSRPVFKGVYARNRLPRLLNVPSALVGNTDPDHRMGQHWIAIYIDAKFR